MLLLYFFAFTHILYEEQGVLLNNYEVGILPVILRFMVKQFVAIVGTQSNHVTTLKKGPAFFRSENVKEQGRGV